MAKPGPKPVIKNKNGEVRKRVGRPPRSASEDPQAAPKDPQAAPKKRGRPLKSAPKPNFDSAPDTAAAPKRRGRPAKAKTTAPQQSQQHQQQEQEQAQSSQIHLQEAILLEVVGTSIQPAFVIHEHGVNSPDLAKAQELKDTQGGKPEGILSRLPSKKEVATAKKLAVKKTQALKKTAIKKATNVAVAASDAAADMEQTTSSWGAAVWSTVTAPVSYLSSGLRRLSGTVER